VFCNVDCWDAHLPIARHRDSWAEDRRSPKKGVAASAPRVVDMRSKQAAPAEKTFPGSGKLSPAPPEDVLVVASKVKAYIKARSGMNTAGSVMTALSEQVRKLCDDAIRTAMKNERKTVMDRDF